MKQLFLLECKKIITSIIYWLFIIAITVEFLLNYGNVEREEIRNASNPTSIFYCAENGQYAEEKNNLLEKDKQNQMMTALTKKLLYCYKNNSYEYYPFGYIKEKSFSESEQAIILNYLQEITGKKKEELIRDEELIKDINEIDSEIPKQSENSSEIEISGNGAYIANPGTGSINESGQYIFEPEEWEYTENPSISSAIPKEKKSFDDFSIQVSFKRFMEIMEKINTMIGKNSYFSKSLIYFYYGENDMDASPITLKQHKEFYNNDKITGAFARYYCDSIALAILLLPALVMSALIAENRRNHIMEVIYTKPISSFTFIFIKYLAAIIMMFLPILLLPLRSFFILFQYANTINKKMDLFAFSNYSIAWILPTLLFITAFSLFLSILTRSFLSIFITGILFLFSRPSIDKMAGGNYELFDLVIRHNTLKGFSRMMESFHMLIINRLCITIISFFFIILSVWIYQRKRNGGFYVQKLIYYHKRKY